ncbi:MAG: (deoxy)nucleoside triphosphate pyrophosphohydrolase [Pseudobdellovibrio sp.]
MSMQDQSSSHNPDIIPVVALALFHPRKNKYLIVRRNSKQSGAGCWEFPGGKVEPGETSRQALVREIQEELSLDIAEEALEFIHSHTHAYPNKKIELSLFRCRSFEENFKLIDHDLFAWVDQKTISGFQLSAADQPFLRYLF